MPRFPRIAIGGIAHETNTYVPTATTLEDVRQRTLLTGEALLANARGTDGALGGIVDAAEGRAEILPTLFASAAPGGAIDRTAFDYLREGLLSRLRAHVHRYPGVDAVVLVQHGAMVVDGVDDAEGALLAEVREVIGDRPLLAVIDFHANLSPAMVDAVDLLVPYRAYPHVDTRARGVEALELALGMTAGRERPTVAWRHLPLLMPLPAQLTEGDAAFARLAADARAMECRPEVLLAALVPGFPYSDVTETGASVLVVTRDNASLANQLADDLAGRWWRGRQAMRWRGVALDRIGEMLDTAAEGPIVLADIADNPGAGAPGDSTWLLRAVLEHGARDVAMATIVDPATVSACHAAGTGARLELAVGGRQGATSGDPVVREWTVRHLGEGVFANEGPIGRGSITRMGRTATVEADGVLVMLAERRAQVMEPAAFVAGGIDPLAMRALIVKSSVHYRAAFSPVAREMIDVETPGPCPSDLSTLPRTRALREPEMPHV